MPDISLVDNPITTILRLLIVTEIPARFPVPAGVYLPQAAALKIGIIARERATAE
jgi:hypothetical protein